VGGRDGSRNAKNFDGIEWGRKKKEEREYKGRTQEGEAFFLFMINLTTLSVARIM
jgi:hypothetical protein